MRLFRFITALAVLMGLLLTFNFTYLPENPEIPLKMPKPKKYDIFVQSDWVDSTLKNMTLDEKIGQLFMVAAWSSKDKQNLTQLRTLVDKYHIGGVIFFKGSPYSQGLTTNDLQQRSRIPLMVGIDAEWGLAMRLDSTVNFGYQMPLGAARNDSIVYRMASEIAIECKRLGIQINFAPVIDINNNPLNPVINLRSFGEDKEKVARKGVMYMRGLQDNHVLAVAKHFPGHGNVEVDSHLDLPVLKQDQKEIDTLELYPFRSLFSLGVGGVMTAHLNIPSYDSNSTVGASLSPTISTLLLKDKMKFKGLTFSDALNMKGVSKYYQPGDLEIKALQAGNDVLLYSEDVPKAIAAIKIAIDSGCISQDVIDAKVRRILQVKKWSGLDSCRYVDVRNITKDLNNPTVLLIKSQIAEEAITVVKNGDKILPVKAPERYRIASVAIGTTTQPAFQQMLYNYLPAEMFDIGMNGSEADWRKLNDTLKNYSLVILSLHNLSNKNTGTYGLSDAAISFVNEITARQLHILANFGSPYALNRFPSLRNVICGYQDDPAFQNAVAEAIGGGVRAKGYLPVSGSDIFPKGSGVVTDKPSKLKYSIPESVGMSSSQLSRIDDIVNQQIKNKVMPGCQILVARNGTVVYDKSFGNYTYDAYQPVTNSSIYDLASVTKVAATTLAAMKLYEEDKLQIFTPASNYLHELASTGKEDIQVRELMTHQAGLIPFIPFYKKLKKPDGTLDSAVFCPVPNSLYNLKVADNIYMNRLFKDTIYNTIDRMPLSGRGTFKYSDLSFIYMQRIIERITGKTLDKYTDSVFYKPLGLATMTFHPKEKFPVERIVPTELDTYFRSQLLTGDVHDPTAAMLGGVAGHSGLFSDANDLAVIMQMLLNGGTYGGKSYLESSTIHLFTSPQFEKNRRALGWDRPAVDPSQGSPASKYASAGSFGHSGFTGTCIWADPKYKLIYIFLSNRVYPSAENNMLAKLNIRTDIHDIIYQSIIAP